jgi:hypothetical protein
LKDGSRTGPTGTRTRQLRQALVVAEIAFAFLLGTAAGLLLASFRNLLAADPGFNAASVLTASFSAPRSTYKGEPELRILMSRMLGSLKAITGVTGVGATTTIPLGGDYDDGVIIAEGHRAKPGESLISPHQINVTPGFFPAMNIPLVRGRDFDDRDKEGVTPVILIDEKLAHHFWPDGNPIGHRMYTPNGVEEAVNPGPKNPLANSHRRRSFSPSGRPRRFRQLRRRLLLPIRAEPRA